jgi:fibro-slime domain-containing protein
MRILHSSLAAFAASLLIAGAAAGCGSSSSGNDSGDTGDDGGDSGDDGGDDSGDSGDDSGDSGDDGGDDGPGVACGQLQATIRDFKPEHPDMEEADGNSDVVEPGLVRDTLGPDDKPVYARTGNAGGIHVESPESFSDWYNDRPNVNIAIPYTITLFSSGGVSRFEDTTFFPIDGQGFGNGTNANNFHFTTEIHTTFEYKGGEVFTFQGDDDLWLFINKKLALDLGGLHPEVRGTVNLDQQAAQLGIQRGQTYAMDIFHAERHTTASNFRIETTIDCFIVD